MLKYLICDINFLFVFINKIAVFSLCIIFTKIFTKFFSNINAYIYLFFLILLYKTFVTEFNASLMVCAYLLVAVVLNNLAIPLCNLKRFVSIKLGFLFYLISPKILLFIICVMFFIHYQF